MDILANLTGFDWIVLLIVGAAAGFGVMRGFIAEIASLAAWVAGFIAVRILHEPAQVFFKQASGSELIGTVSAVIGPFLLAMLAVKLIGKFLSSSAKANVIGPLDRLLGLGFGLLKGVLASSLLFLLITLSLAVLPGTGDRPIWLAKAKTTPTLALVASALAGYVGEAWREQQSQVNPHAGLPGFDGGEAGDEAAPQGGYGREDRRSLDALLDEQEKSTPSTSI